MAVELPHEVAAFLNFIGVPYPDIDEDQVRELSRQVRNFALQVQSTHDSATGAIKDMGSVYSGYSYETLVATWARMSAGHMAELDRACKVVAVALNVAADVIEVLKVAVLAHLAALAATYVSAMAATVPTGGASAAVAQAAAVAARKIVDAMQEAVVGYLISEVLDKAIEPLEQTLEKMINDAVYHRAAEVLDVPPNQNLYIEPEEVMRYANMLDSYADDMLNHASDFAENVARLNFSTTEPLPPGSPADVPQHHPGPLDHIGDRGPSIAPHPSPRWTNTAPETPELRAGLFPESWRSANPQTSPTPAYEAGDQVGRSTPPGASVVRPGPENLSAPQSNAPTTAPNTPAPQSNAPSYDLPGKASGSMPDNTGGGTIAGGNDSPDPAQRGERPVIEAANQRHEPGPLSESLLDRPIAPNVATTIPTPAATEGSATIGPVTAPPTAAPELIDPQPHRGTGSPTPASSGSSPRLTPGPGAPSASRNSPWAKGPRRRRLPKRVVSAESAPNATPWSKPDLAPAVGAAVFAPVDADSIPVVESIREKPTATADTASREQNRGAATLWRAAAESARKPQQEK